MSSASTAATESSQSTIVVTADSSTTSLTPAGMVLADRVVAVDLDLDVQAVVPQQDAGEPAVRLAVADERRGIGQPDPRAALERGDELLPPRRSREDGTPATSA